MLFNLQFIFNIGSCTVHTSHMNGDPTRNVTALNFCSHRTSVYCAMRMSLLLYACFPPVHALCVPLLTNQDKDVKAPIHFTFSEHAPVLCACPSLQSTSHAPTFKSMLLSCLPSVFLFFPHVSLLYSADAPVFLLMLPLQPTAHVPIVRQ